MAKRINSLNTFLKSNVEVEKQLYNRSDTLGVVLGAQSLPESPGGILEQVQQGKSDVCRGTASEL